MAGQKNIERRNKILKNTFEFSRKLGIDNVSLQMIADKSDISKSLLQAYYPHKSNLVIEIATTFMTTVLDSISKEKYSEESEFVKMKLIIYIILQMGHKDRSIAKVLDSFMGYNNSIERWGQILETWLDDDHVRAELGNIAEAQNGLYFIIPGGGSLYLKRALLELNAEEISDIMVKTFMISFLDLPISKVKSSLAEGHEVIKKVNTDKVFELINTMFD